MEHILVYLIIIAVLMIAGLDLWMRKILKARGYQTNYILGRLKNERNFLNLIRSESDTEKQVNKYKLVLGLKAFSYLIFIGSGVALIF